ncbi:MAG: heavy metal-associated domain-containing protein [Verrucomicrobiales bacterium]|nr:heavy metal-associated domain-containing protein [Verrucomicrobiales bacterium]
MQNIIVILVAVFGLLVSPSFAGETTTYIGSLSGIDCTGCKKTIAKSIGKLKGVKTIRIEKKSENSHKLIVITDGSKAISKADAIKALGKNVDHYKITGWSKS